jgi:nucleotide-binding universal stress UspA family protein
LADDALLNRIIEAERASGRRDLDAAAARLRTTGVADIEVVVANGTPGESIVDAAEALRCDVIVMSTQGRGGGGAARLLGSVADHVLQHVAHAAVVVAPPRTSAG